MSCRAGDLGQSKPAIASRVTRSGSRALGIKIGQPSPVKFDGRRRPALDDRRVCDGGKFRNEIRTAVSQRERAEFNKNFHRIGVEIATGNFRIAVRSSAEEPADVAAIFAMQRVSIVFGMPLKKDEQAAALARKHVGTSRGRSRQNPITPGGKHVLRETVKP